jgi:hypothetical protein
VDQIRCTPEIRFVGSWSDADRARASRAIRRAETESLPPPLDSSPPWLCLARETDLCGTVYFAQRFCVRRVFVGYTVTELVRALGEINTAPDSPVVDPEKPLLRN